MDGRTTLVVVDVGIGRLVGGGPDFGTRGAGVIQVVAAPADKQDRVGLAERTGEGSRVGPGSHAASPVKTTARREVGFPAELSSPRERSCCLVGEPDE